MMVPIVPTVTRAKALTLMDAEQTPELTPSNLQASVFWTTSFFIVCHDKHAAELTVMLRQHGKHGTFSRRDRNFGN